MDTSLDPESKNGQNLLLRTEFHGQCEYRASALVARRTKDDPIMPQSRLICGMYDQFDCSPSCDKL